MPNSARRARDQVGQARVRHAGELEVHGRAQVGHAVLVVAEEVQGRLEHVVEQRQHQLLVVELVEERARGQHAVGGLPACERLDRDHLARAQRDDRLEVGDDPPAAEAVVEVGQLPDPVGDGRPQRLGGEDGRQRGSDRGADLLVAGGVALHVQRQVQPRLARRVEHRERGPRPEP